MLLAPHQRFGSYELERKLGMGGMAEVWLAHPLEPGHRYPRVVIKRIHPHLADDKKLVGLFLDELQVVQRLDHPNVVHVFDGGVFEDDFFMAMEFIDGLDLRTCVDVHGGPLWPAMAVALVAQACVGLHYAHSLKTLTGKPLNLVHRDISPDNLMVDRSGQVKVVDFGIARAVTTQNTTFTGFRKGKIRYMAPEYMDEQHIADACTDVYALGVTLWELVTGMRPFEELNGPAVMYAAIEDGLPSADTVRPSLPKQLVDLVSAATARERKQRLKTAAEFEERLRDFLELYRPPTRAEIGSEIALWKAKVDGVGRLPRARAAGSFGQLESTEMLSVAKPVGKAGTRQAGPRSVFVAHQLDNTEVAMPAYRAEKTDTDVDVRPPGEHSEPNVVLPPDLEQRAVRTRGTPKKKQKKRRRGD